MLGTNEVQVHQSQPARGHVTLSCLFRSLAGRAQPLLWSLVVAWPSLIRELKVDTVQRGGKGQVLCGQLLPGRLTGLTAAETTSTSVSPLGHEDSLRVSVNVDAMIGMLGWALDWL